MIEVIDTGIGVADKALSHVIERPDRADKVRTIQDTGVGLGLSIAKRIVELHHGKIEVESTPGQGSTFRIVLPVEVVADTFTTL